ncbi:Csu type fimbrial protein [Photobacterium sp. GSS17]|uniref:Csu type fimbrial protein n=1 Tax=Photobacterium sp. GSS17 TaxID=3020715 RepID=UPI0023631180|nr:spore coat U domain-containing protein [Photobacterium sp. GSS17]
MAKPYRFTVLTVALLCLSSNSFSASVSGTINVNISLEAGCVINGNNTLDGDSAIDFGTLNFGSVPTVFVQQDSAVTGGAANGIAVVCSSGVTPSFAIASGNNDGSIVGGVGNGNHTMSDGSGNYVDYAIFSDPARSNRIENNTSILMAVFTDTTPQTIELYGRAYGTSNVAGSYSDTLNVTLSW